ncbi:MAG: LuxR C-terminal-related transcriptional regulator [Anaerolineae bacterium]
MSTNLILKTKLHIPPTRPDAALRGRLMAQLNVGWQAGYRLILVSAPAGYGKTTLLSAWAHTQPAAWLSLDEDDNDPARFTAHLIAALQTREPALGQDVLDALRALQPPPPESLYAALVNQLDGITTPLALVLDDYHFITALPVHQAITFLLDHLPAQIRLVIATRSDPLLPLARLRGRGQLLELRQDDLRFTPEEAAQFLEETMGLALSLTDVATLTARTEGWAAGLQMAALSLRGRPDASAFIREFGGGHRYILEYLLEEVLNRQSEAIQAFLMKTSVLDRLSGPLCDAILGEDAPGQGNAQAILDEFERANLFIIPLDDERRWYRYHHLFADLLRQRLRQLADAETIAALYLRASAWYEQEGLIAEAVSCALAVSDYTYAAALVERHVLPFFYRSETVLVYSWLKALPETLLRSRPLLCAVYAGCLVLVTPSPATFEQADVWLTAAETALVTAPARNADEVRGFILKFRAYLARFRGAPSAEVIALSQEALERLPQGNSWFRSALYFNLGAAYWDMGDEAAAIQAWKMCRTVGEACGDLFNALAAVHALAIVAFLYGQLREAVAICQEALQSIAVPAEHHGRSLPISGLLHVTLGIIHLYRNELQEAEASLTRGLALLALTSSTYTRLEGHFALARLKQAQGDASGAMDVLRQAEHLYALRGLAGDRLPFYQGPAHVAVYRARLWVQQAHYNPQRLDDAVRWARERNLKLDSERYNTAQFVLARLIVAQHQRHAAKPLFTLSELGDFLNRQFRMAQQEHVIGWQVEVLILQVLVYHIQGDLTHALATLQQALSLAEPEGYARVFLDEGPPMAELLRLGAQRGVWRPARLAAYADRLLAAFPDFVVRPSASVPPAGLIEPLSERELEVLRLLDDGFSNRQIAEKLIVTVGTVKSHVHNIYGKLGVERRTEALARARDLHLL